MYDEPPGGGSADSPLGAPSPEARERVLRQCRRAMAARFLAERRRKQRQRGTLVAVVAALLLLNWSEEQRVTTRLQGIQRGPSQVAEAPPRGSAILYGLRAREALAAVLLHDPNAL